MSIRRRIFLSYVALVSVFLIFLGSYVYIGVLRTHTDGDLTRLYRVKSSWGDMLISLNNVVNNWDDGRSFSTFMNRLDEFQTGLESLHSSGNLRFYYPTPLKTHREALYRIWSLAQDNIRQIISGIDDSNFQRVVQEITREPGLQRLNHLWTELFYRGSSRQRSDAYAIRRVLDSIEFFPIYSSTMTRQFNIVVQETSAVYENVIHIQLVLALSFFGLFLIGYFTFSILFTRSISRPIVDVSRKLTEFIGQTIEAPHSGRGDELELLDRSVTMLIAHYTALSEHARVLAEGDIDSASVEIPKAGVVGNALGEISNYLRKLARVSAWIRDGNYGAEIEVKSDKDVLGRTFNIMSHVIHEKITTLSRVFDAMDQSLLVIDVQGKVVESNNRLLSLLEVDSIEYLSGPDGLQHYFKDFARFHDRLLAGRLKENHSTTMISGSGNQIPVRITARFLEPLPGEQNQIMLFISNESWKMRMKRERERLKSQAVVAELKSLRAQINPHFLFNTLNTIIQLIETSPELAVNTTEKLADLFRYTLSTTERDTVSVGEELTHIRQFLQIEQTRFGENLKVDYDIDSAVESLPIPPMLLQPIVENSLRHGKDSEGRVHIHIQADWIGTDVIFQIADHGSGSDVRAFHTGRGIGLKNVRNRLRTLYGNTIRIEPNEPQGVVVSISIPADRQTGGQACQ